MAIHISKRSVDDPGFDLAAFIRDRLPDGDWDFILVSPLKCVIPGEDKDGS